MPLYEYCCESCEHSFELLTSVTNRDKALKKPCPECGEKKIKKGFGVPITGANANITPEKMCPGFTKKMEEISRSMVVDRASRKRIEASTNMRPSGHLRPS
jgi:putative FmdB family regulatory protein